MSFFSIGRRGRILGAVDIAILIAVAATGFRVISGYAQSGTEATPILQIGSRVPDLGIGWNQSSRHLLMFVSDSCPACRQSVDTYRRLTALAEAAGVTTSVVAAEPVQQISTWLQRERIQVDHVVRLDEPANIGVFMIPLLVLTDSKRTVTDLMARQLSADEEARLAARIKHNASPPITNSIAAREQRRSSLSGLTFDESNPLVDIGPREAAASKRFGQLAMPIDELNERAAIELADRRSVYVDCRNVALLHCRLAGMHLTGLGLPNVTLLVN